MDQTYKLGLIGFKQSDLPDLRDKIIRGTGKLENKDISDFASLGSAYRRDGSKEYPLADQFIMCLSFVTNFRDVEHAMKNNYLNGQNIVFAYKKEDETRFDGFVNQLNKKYGISKTLILDNDIHNMYERSSGASFKGFLENWLAEPKRQQWSISHEAPSPTPFPITPITEQKTALDMETITNELFPLAQRMNDFAGVKSAEATRARIDVEGKNAFQKLIHHRQSEQPKLKENDIISGLMEALTAKTPETTPAEMAISILAELEAETTVSAKVTSTPNRQSKTR